MSNVFRNKRALDITLEHMKEVASKPKPKDLLAIPAEAKPEVARLALNYLDAFGYLSNALGDWKDITIGDIISAIKKFQTFFGMKRVGSLTARDIRLMKAPRCGCPDYPREDLVGAMRLRAAADANLTRWRKDGITYAISDYVPGLAKIDFETIVADAFASWSSVCQFDINRATSHMADIIISTGRGAQDNFDGPSGVLAWAYMPDGSDQQLTMKFDLDETWILDPMQRGILIANVAAHEFGHCAIGLGHSRLQSALMAPYYNAAIAKPQQQDDIPRAVARYGPRITTTPPVTPPPGSSARVDITSSPGVSVYVNNRQVA